MEVVVNSTKPPQTRPIQLATPPRGSTPFPQHKRSFSTGVQRQTQSPKEADDALKPMRTPIPISLYITYIQRGYLKARGIRNQPTNRPASGAYVRLLQKTNEREKEMMEYSLFLHHTSPTSSFPLPSPNPVLLAFPWNIATRYFATTHPPLERKFIAHP